jgi:hypothetical protein
MKRIIFIVSGILITLLLLGYSAINVLTDIAVKRNINIAKGSFPGSAEDALIAYLLDTTNSPQNRSNITVWTLGQIESEKAIPILNRLYKNDPEGKTCYGRHDSALCQYEIYKALNARKVNWWPLHSRLNK